MLSRLSRLRLLSVLLTLVLVAPPLGGRWSARLGAQAASSQTSDTTNDLRAVACPHPSACVAIGKTYQLLFRAAGEATSVFHADANATFKVTK